MTSYLFMTKVMFVLYQFIRYLQINKMPKVWPWEWRSRLKMKKNRDLDHLTGNVQFCIDEHFQNFSNCRQHCLCNNGHTRTSTHTDTHTHTHANTCTCTHMHTHTHIHTLTIVRTHAHIALNKHKCFCINAYWMATATLQNAAAAMLF